MAMTATSTRSTRRAGEGLIAHHPHHPQRTTSATTAQAARLHQQLNVNSGRKRLLDATNLKYDLKPTKKAKLTVEIPSKSQYQARLFPEKVDARHHHHPHRVASAATTHNIPPKQYERQAASAPPPANAYAPAPTPAPAPKAAATSNDNEAINGLTKHREKVVNGIKHELDRLQPSSADMASNNQGRKLRSQEGVRFKSELSAYFPEYDEVIGNIPKEQHVLMLDTPIIIVDTYPSSSSTSFPCPEPHSPPSTVPLRSYGDNLFTNLHDSQTIDLSWLESQYKGKTLSDPLPDSYYEPIHRKESRNEKITRNAEKCRSQHEKEQVIRLLDGLKGPDWLKTMGVSGITESKKKQFEPARAHFIQKCEVVLEKFRKWAAEEKRLKLEKERVAKVSRASQDSGSVHAEEDEKEEDETVEASEDEEGDGDDDKGEEANDQPDLSDVEASAKQLHEEAMARSRMTAKSARRHPAIPFPPPPEPEFTSFFKKSWQRDAALNKTRRRGRTVLAWGYPVTEPDERDFELPEEYRDEDMLKARARRLRRVQRGSKNRG